MNSTSQDLQGLDRYFGPLEAKVMAVLWNHAPLTVSQVVSELDSKSSYSTVKTILERLSAKGHLTFQRENRAYAYSPAVSREEFREHMAQHSTNELVDSFGSLAISHFVRAVRKNSANVSELRALLADIPEDE